MDIRKILTQKNYSVIAELYIKDFEKNYENFYFVDDLFKLLSIRNLKEHPIVDLGSGPGTVIDYILQKKKNLSTLIAVDFNQPFCERMNRKYIHKNNIKIVHEDIVDFTKRQKPSTVGAYIAAYSVIHIPDGEINELFSSIHKSLVKGGLVLISCFRGQKKSMERERYQVIKDIRLKYDETLLCYMNYFSETELAKRLEKIGFEIVKMEVLPSGEKIADIPNKQIWVIAEKN